MFSHLHLAATIVRNAIGFLANIKGSTEKHSIDNQTKFYLSLAISPTETNNRSTL